MSVKAKHCFKAFSPSIHQCILLTNFFKVLYCLLVFIFLISKSMYSRQKWMTMWNLLICFAFMWSAVFDSLQSLSKQYNAAVSLTFYQLNPYRELNLMHFDWSRYEWNQLNMYHGIYGNLQMPHLWQRIWLDKVGLY